MVLYHSFEYQTSFESTGLSIQEKKLKTDFQDGDRGSQVAFWIRRRTSNIFFKIFLIEFLSTSLSGTIQDKKFKNRFLRWWWWWPSWISDLNYFSYFWSTSHLNSLESINLSIKEKNFKIDFQDGPCGSHPGFPIGMNLAIFDLQVTPILPSKFWVNQHFRRTSPKNRFSKWQLWWPSWISNPKDLQVFSTYNLPQYFLPSFVWVSLSVQEKLKKDFQDGLWNNFSYFFIHKPPQYFLPSFQSADLSVQEEFKIDFQDEGYLGFPIRMTLAISDLKTYSNHLVNWSGTILAILVESPRQHSSKVWLKLAQGCRRNCHLSKRLMLHDRRCMPDTDC